MLDFDYTLRNVPNISESFIVLIYHSKYNETYTYEILHNFRHNILGVPTSEENEKIGLGSEKKVYENVFQDILFLYNM